VKYLKRFNEARGVDLDLDPDKKFYEEVRETCEDILLDLTDEGIEYDVFITKQLGFYKQPSRFKGLRVVIGEMSTISNNDGVVRHTDINLNHLIKVIERLNNYLKVEEISLQYIEIANYHHINPKPLSHTKYISGRSSGIYNSVVSLEKDINDADTHVCGIITVNYQLNKFNLGQPMVESSSEAEDAAYKDERHDIELSEEIESTCDNILYDLEDEGIDCLVNASGIFIKNGIRVSIGSKDSKVDLYTFCKSVDRMSVYLKGEGFRLSDVWSVKGSDTDYQRNEYDFQCGVIYKALSTHLKPTDIVKSAFGHQFIASNFMVQDIIELLYDKIII
jgi:hypothetical protein